VAGLAVLAALAGAPGDARGAEGPDLAANPIVLVVDISGSMGDDDGTGRTKMDGAKLALLDFLDQVEPGTPIGLRTYPDQAGGSCNTGTVRFPIAPRDPTTMSAAIRALQPDGDTPTAEAMRAAASDLKADGYTHGTMVIVSDGESTCSSPCDAAHAIAQSGIDLQTITVGFRISDAGRKELQCIADATNGTYVDVTDSAGLADALSKISRPALEIKLTYPRSVVAEVGDDPRGLADVSAQVTNTADQEARDVTASMLFEGASPGLSRPVLRLGNLAPNAVRTVSWSFRPGDLLAGTRLSFEVVARADNGLSDSVAGGAIAITQVDSAAEAGPILRDRRRLAILGDSYSSGEGADRYIAGTDTDENGCHRSDWTYLMQQFHQPDSSVIACSGAVVNDLFFPDTDNHVRSQLDQLATLQRARGVDAVVMTLGGNNALFSHLAVACLAPKLDCTKEVFPNFWTPWHWLSGEDFMAKELNSTLRDSLSDAYADISGVVNSSAAVRSRGSVAPILVLAYASPIPLTARSCLGALDQLKPDEIAFIGRFVGQLNGLVEAAVASARQRNVPVFFVANTEDAFQPDHTVCDAQPYARGLTSFNGADEQSASLGEFLKRGKQELLHPNIQGYAAESSAIIRWSLGAKARADEAWLQTGDAARIPSLTIDTSTESLGQLQAGETPQLQPGTSYPLSVGGFAPGSEVQIVVHSAPLLLAEVHADAAGRVRTRVGIPPGLPGGPHVLEVRGAQADGKRTRIVSVPFRVARASGPLALRAAELAGIFAGALALFSWSAFAVLRRRVRLAAVRGV
jgi:hypothetical protein